MVQQMAQTPQPSLLSSWVAAFGRFDAAHGWAVNLFVVVALAAIGVAFLIRSAPAGARGRDRRSWSCAWPPGCSSKTSASWEVSGPTPTAWCQ